MHSRAPLGREQRPRRTAAEESPATARPGAIDAETLAEGRDADPHGGLPAGSVLDGNRRHGFLVAPENRAIHRGKPLPAGSGSIRLHDIGRGRLPGRRAGAAFQPNARMVEPGFDVRGLCGRRLPRHRASAGHPACRSVRAGGFPRGSVVFKLLHENRCGVRHRIVGCDIRGRPSRSSQLPWCGRVCDLAGTTAGMVGAPFCWRCCGRTVTAGFCWDGWCCWPIASRPCPYGPARHGRGTACGSGW
jgi:hypothetical protein